MALLPSKSNSSFTWCCSSSVRAVPPYRSWKEQDVHIKSYFEKSPRFLFGQCSPLQATQYVCSCHHHHFQMDIVLQKICSYPTLPCKLFSKEPLECLGDARISRNLGLSLFTASLVTLSKCKHKFDKILFVTSAAWNPSWRNSWEDELLWFASLMQPEHLLCLSFSSFPPSPDQDVSYIDGKGPRQSSMVWSSPCL